MKWLPRTLLARTFLAVSIVLVMSVLAWLRIYTAYEREPRARQLAQMVVSVVNLTRSALVSAQPDKRADLLSELSVLEGIRIYPAEADDELVPLPDDPLFRLVTDHISRALGADTRYASAREGLQGFWVSFRIAQDDEYWVVLPSERLERTLPAQWIGWGAAALLLALVATFLIMFRVSRPLHALSEAAMAVGRGERPSPIPQQGPEEIAAVARTFNRMAKDLQQLDADRALILAGISHDLRTPLARLRLGAELAGGDACLREGMAADVDEMERIIAQFLDFAREAAGEPLEAVDIQQLATEVVEIFRRRGAKIELEVAAMPLATVRPRAVRRLLSNLIDNALRYATIALPVEVACRSEADVLVLEVADRGPGIPAEQIERLKRPFTRLEPARSGLAGSGLGLAIVDRICRAHGGRLELLRREGGGLLARARLGQPGAPTHPDSKVTPVPRPLPQGNIHKS